MNDNLISIMTASTYWILGQNTIDVGLPAFIKDGGSMAIVAFVVWYTMTRIQPSIERLSVCVTKLEKKIDGIPTYGPEDEKD